MPKETEVVQLTNRNPKAVWKTKNKETGKTEFIQMADMSDYHLQGALVLCQKRKLEKFKIFLADCKREEQLKQAAKDRNMKIQDLGYIKATFIGCLYCEFEEIMTFAFKSIMRKQKSLKEKVI